MVAGLRDRLTPMGEPFPGTKTIIGNPTGPDAFGFSPELKSRLAAERQGADVIHSHGLWMHPGVIARDWARSGHMPLVISPHGMLDRWALVRSRWKKRIVAMFFENYNLRSANCLHAVCAAEARDIRDYGLRNPIAIIPNGVDLEQFDSRPSYSAIENDHPALRGKKRMLFLSRVHPKKGLPHLLRAWKNLGREADNWALLIAGGDQNGHAQEVAILATELGLGKAVVFLGPLQGEAKKRALAGSDAFVLPSFSEGFSMAVLEAAAFGLPVLFTPQCNFPELTACGGAIEAAPNEKDCLIGLRRMFSLPASEMKRMGLRAQALIENHYTLQACAARMASVYGWLLNREALPECVSLN
jgi:poly(glycerol-phosphate) alpha-glucosyltransferase